MHVKYEVISVTLIFNALSHALISVRILNALHQRRSLLLLAGVLEGSDEIWNIVIIVLSCLSLWVDVDHLLLKELILLWSNLLEDVGHHIFQRLSFWDTSNYEKVFSDRELSLWFLEMNDGVIVLEHIDLINVLELLHTELLNG